MQLQWLEPLVKNAVDRISDPEVHSMFERADNGGRRRRKQHSNAVNVARVGAARRSYGSH